MSTQPIRKTLVTIALSAMVAAVAVGVPASGQSNEVAPDEACRGAVWPMIPLSCVGRDDDGAVRLVGADIWSDERYAQTQALSLRLQQAFEVEDQVQLTIHGGVQ